MIPVFIASIKTWGKLAAAGQSCVSMTVFSDGVIVLGSSNRCDYVFMSDVELGDDEKGDNPIPASFRAFKLLAFYF